ncbi:MAG TPA: ribulose-phosphate 3-epimerase [Bacillota bacterium]|nr:ribulose-phosphate 3-epimerase [Bacillota bacterium]
MRNKVAVSIMCADQLNLAEELRRLEASRVDLLHCDVMDGKFVKNLAMGPYILEAIKRETNIPLDIHLATEDPAYYIDMFAPIKPKYISFHVEASVDVQSNIDKIKQYGIEPVIAISPETPIEDIFPYVSNVSMVLLMTVNPGFSGQAFNYDVLKKLSDLQKKIEPLDHKPLIQVDGNINDKTVPLLVERQANVFVLGTSQLFNDKPGSYDDKIADIRTLISKEVSM